MAPCPFLVIHPPELGCCVLRHVSSSRPPEGPLNKHQVTSGLVAFEPSIATQITGGSWGPRCPPKEGSAIRKDSIGSTSWNMSGRRGADLILHAHGPEGSEWNDPNIVQPCARASERTAEALPTLCCTGFWGVGERLRRRGVFLGAQLCQACGSSSGRRVDDATREEAHGGAGGANRGARRSQDAFGQRLPCGQPGSVRDGGDETPGVGR